MHIAVAMPLQPEHNQNYWPLLLTDELYLLPDDLKKVQQQLKPAAAQDQQGASAPAVAAPVQAVAEQQVKQAAAGATTSNSEPAQKAVVTPDLLWGSAQRGVLILVNYPQHPLMERQDGLFLVEVLKAVGFDFKEVATLNIQRCQSEADWDYVRNVSCQYIVSFGVQIPELSFTQKAQLYQQTKAGEKTILMAEELSNIRQDVGSKKKLWNLLKQVFV